MANQKSGCGSIFAFFGAILGFACANLIYEETAEAWQQGNHSPAAIVGAIATGAVALAGAAYRVREFDIMEWNAWRRKRTRDGR
ncbi:hypothetical protein [Streptomyces hirsutus]|uniref:hypothetical protein n=1 Tax=Streptomyces hirsutus TaxID=35620 RepID=UPI0033F1E62A